MLDELPYAEDIGHYWKTGQSSPDVWIDRAKKVITDMGGSIQAEGFGSTGGHAGYMLAFTIQGQKFKVVWPVLPIRYGNKEVDARRQAATLLYHDIKAKAMTASVMGARVAFFSYLALPDGRTASDVATPELGEHFPLMLKYEEK
jgi:hypothetical protein